MEREFYLDNEGRVARVVGETLEPLPDEQLNQLPPNTWLAGVFGDPPIDAREEDVTVTSAPVRQDRIATMSLAARAASDTEGEGVIWHPTYTATVEWLVDARRGTGEWIFKLYQDAIPDFVVAECGMGVDGNGRYWEGGSDFTTLVVAEVAAVHIPALLALARAGATPE